MAELDNTQLSKHNFKEKKTRMIHSSEGTDVGFECTDYCPAVFRNILKFQKVGVNEYMEAVCGEEHIKRVISYGKCGSVFVASLDDRFVTKILRKSELKVLLEILPNYYRHLMTYKFSLLSKLLGLHVVSPQGGAKVYFAVAYNLMKSNHQIHGCYDLKGTTIGRNNLKLVTDNRLILKDEDFDFSFHLDPLLYHRLLRQIKYDCEFLEAEGIMDYSFLVSVHMEKQHEDLLCKRSISRESSSSGRSSAIESNSSSVDISNYTFDESYDLELSLSYLCPPSESAEKFGVEMPARAMRIPKHSDESDKAEEYHNVILNFGIVDIFERYNTLKRLEHVYKSVQHRSTSVGTVDPKTYSCRLQDFLSRVFQSEEDDGGSMSAYAGQAE